MHAYTVVDDGTRGSFSADLDGRCVAPSPSVYDCVRQSTTSCIARVPACAAAAQAVANKTKPKGSNSKHAGATMLNVRVKATNWIVHGHISASCVHQTHPAYNKQKSLTALPSMKKFLRTRRTCAGTTALRACRPNNNHRNYVSALRVVCRWVESMGAAYFPPNNAEAGAPAGDHLLKFCLSRWHVLVQEITETRGIGYFNILIACDGPQLVCRAPSCRDASAEVGMSGR